MLVMGDKVYTQSAAVMKAAARKCGLMPADEELQYQVDNLLAAADDYRSCAYKPIFAAMGGKPSPELNSELKDKIIPVHFKNFERLLGDNDFFVGNAISVVDLGIFDILK